MAKEHIFIANMHLSVLENQLLSSIFADYISILSKLRRNTADIQQKWKIIIITTEERRVG